MNLKHFNIEDQKIITGLDLGSKSIKCVMGMLGDDGHFEIIGSSSIEHNGIHNQQIIDSRATSQAIRKVCQEVEIISEKQITDLWVALSSPFQTFSSQGMAIITGGQVNQKHIRQSIATALAVPLPDHQEVVHVLPCSFQVDKRDSVYNPVGLSGMRLETSVLLVTCDLSAIQDWRQCISNAGRTARGFVVQSLATGLAVTSHEDKNQGVCVIDIGRHSSQISVFSSGRCIYLYQIKKGGDDITSSLVRQLKISPSLAEQLKFQYGIPYEQNPFQLGENLPITYDTYRNSITHSAQTCFSPIKEELRNQNLIDQIPNGIILTGGGSLLKNISQWARFYFDKPVHCGKFLNVSDSFKNKLEYSSCLGLLYYSKDDRLDFKDYSKSNNTMMRNWLKDLIF